LQLEKALAIFHAEIFAPFKATGPFAARAKEKVNPPDNQVAGLHFSSPKLNKRFPRPLSGVYQQENQKSTL